MKVAFLDRDGTMIEDYPDDVWEHVTEPIFLEGAIQGLIKLRDLGYQFVIVTNQYLINEGFILLEQYKSIQNQMEISLSEYGIKILKTYFCPHARDEGCTCCKPSIGMIEQAMNEFPDIDLTQSIFIGDSLCDLQLANRMGIAFYGVGKKELGTWMYDSLLEVAVSKRDV